MAQPPPNDSFDVPKTMSPDLSKSNDNDSFFRRLPEWMHRPRRPVSDDELNAYVRGTLTPDADEEVRWSICGDPALLARVEDARRRIYQDREFIRLEDIEEPAPDLRRLIEWARNLRDEFVTDIALAHCAVLNFGGLTDPAGGRTRAIGGSRSLGPAPVPAPDQSVRLTSRGVNLRLASVGAVLQISVSVEGGISGPIRIFRLDPGQTEEPGGESLGEEILPGGTMQGGRGIVTLTVEGPMALRLVLPDGQRRVIVVSDTVS